MDIRTLIRPKYENQATERLNLRTLIQMTDKHNNQSINFNKSITELSKSLTKPTHSPNSLSFQKNDIFNRLHKHEKSESPPKQIDTDLTVVLQGSTKQIQIKPKPQPNPENKESVFAKDAQTNRADRKQQWKPFGSETKPNGKIIQLDRQPSRKVQNMIDSDSMIVRAKMNSMNGVANRLIGNTDQPTKLYAVCVTNVPSEATEQNMKRFFMQFGKVVKVKIDESTRKAIVSYTSRDGQERAVAMADQKKISDHIVRVSVVEESDNVMTTSSGLKITSSGENVRRVSKV